MSIQKSEIKLDVNGKSVNAYLASPANGGPGILLLHAWWGLKPFFKELCEQIAAQGYSVLAPDMFDGQVARTIDEAKDELAEIVQQAVKNRTKIIVPAFSLGRTQELVYLLHELTDGHKIPRIPIYIDSPLAGNLSEVFMRHSEDFDEESWRDFGVRGESPLAFRNLTYTQSIEESKALNTKPGPFMIISASGMAEGGRILHHLKNNIEDNNAIILFTGYQAEHTLGRKIIEGISPVRIFGRQYKVNAQIRKINELSAHADQAGLLDYIDHTKDLKNVFVVLLTR